MKNSSAPEKFKNHISNTIAGLNVIKHVTVTWNSDRTKIHVEDSYAFCPDFLLVYSEEYNMYHLYIKLKDRDVQDKQVVGYSIMRIGSAIAACQFVSMVTTMYSRRTGPNWSSSEAE